MSATVINYVGLCDVYTISKKSTNVIAVTKVDGIGLTVAIQEAHPLLRDRDAKAGRTEMTFKCPSRSSKVAPIES